MRRLFIRLILALLLFSAPALAQQATRWLGTWAASPMGAPVNLAAVTGQYYLSQPGSDQRGWIDVACRTDQ